MKKRTTIATALVTFLAAALLSLPAAAANLQEQVKQETRKFRDMTATMLPEKINQQVLIKMGKSFSRSYEFKRATITFKDPDKFKIEGAIGLIRVQYIMNGEIRTVRIPSVHYSRKDDLSDESGKTQTCLDMGIVTDGLWASYNVRQIDTENTDSGPVIVLELARIGDPRRNQKIWVDGKNFCLLKREKYRNEGDMKVRYVYKDHKMLDGVVWAPMKTELYDRNGKLAAVSVMRNVKVNTGVSDSIFR